MRTVKLLYYLRSLRRLAAAVRHRRQLLARLVMPRGEIELHDGTVLRLGALLHLLILEETVCSDSYRLAELPDHPQRIIDVGAGIGDFTIAAARRFPGCRVVAVEPDPAAFELLRWNLARNGLGNVEAHRAAVGLEAAYALRPGRLASVSSVRPWAGEGVPDAVGLPLGRLLEGGEVNLLKIDCEGAEVEVLHSAPREALRRVRRIALEYHNLSARSDQAVADFLRRRGFRVCLAPDAYDRRIGYIYGTRAAGRLCGRAG